MINPAIGAKAKTELHWFCRTDAQLEHYLRAVLRGPVGVGYPHVSTRVPAEPQLVS